MEKINFNYIQERKQSTARNDKEALMEQIIDQCHFKSEKEKETAARRLAIACNTAHWSLTDLHALLKKRQDPTIRNYTAFVMWSCRVRLKRD